MNARIVAGLLACVLLAGCRTGLNVANLSATASDLNDRLAKSESDYTYLDMKDGTRITLTNAQRQGGQVCGDTIDDVKACFDVASIEDIAVWNYSNCLIGTGLCRPATEPP